VIVPGGGAAVESIRRLDRIHGLGEEVAHWLAVRMLSVQAQFVAELLSPAAVLADPRHAAVGKYQVLDPYPFLMTDERENSTVRLPRSWAVTSDSIALRAALVAQAGELVLLKSVTIPQDVDWESAARAGWVDAHFPRIVGSAQFPIRAVNLREAA
jgi:aspartokinase-like uncharacterized kinase